MLGKEKDTALSKIAELIIIFEKNIDQYKKYIYDEVNVQTNFIVKRLDEVVDEDIEKYLYYMVEKKKLHVLSDGCICE